MTAPSEGTYDNRFEEDNVYGHALGLLLRHRVKPPEGAIHLDIGCGYGRIAEPLTSALGVAYVGCDIDPSGRESLESRGFEAHFLDLNKWEDLFDTLSRYIDGRPVVGISMLDTLEHLPNTEAVLEVLNRLAKATGALVVLSVPNITHFDIGAKLLLGRWDVTDVGILDRTHMRAFSAKSFAAELRASGLHPIAWNNTKPARSDQHFPSDHPLLNETTELGGLLLGLRLSTDAEHANALQLICLCVAGPIGTDPPYSKAYEAEKRPFLTALIRTQGRRGHTLRETLLCLHGQTDQNFEVLVVGHRLDPSELKSVERIIDDQPEVMRKRTRLIRVNDGNRTKPLNVGFEAARGTYISILDDDDVPLGHWVETFRALANRAPGRLLRTGCVRQSVRSVIVHEHEGLRAEGAPERLYPHTFNIFEHLRSNQSPPVGLAFPRGAFHDLGLRFDETLTTTEDWDYVMKVALLLGTESAGEITGIYRWWTIGQSSRTDHDSKEWERNHQAILRAMDTRTVILSPGGTAQLRDLLSHCDWQSAQIGELQEKRDELEAKLIEIEPVSLRLQTELQAERHESHHLQQELSNLRYAIHQSSSFRVARMIPRPLRAFLRRTLGLIRNV